MTLLLQDFDVITGNSGRRRLKLWIITETVYCEVIDYGARTTTQSNRAGKLFLFKFSKLNNVWLWNGNDDYINTSIFSDPCSLRNLPWNKGRKIGKAEAKGVSVFENQTSPNGRVWGDTESYRPRMATGIPTYSSLLSHKYFERLQTF